MFSEMNEETEGMRGKWAVWESWHPGLNHVYFFYFYLPSSVHAEYFSSLL